jgi:hypothetical protein
VALRTRLGTNQNQLGSLPQSTKKNLAVFSIFLLASIAIGAAPILIGIVLDLVTWWNRGADLRSHRS